MQPIQTHGLWDGINPFKNCLVEKNKEDKIGIITRERFVYLNKSTFGLMFLKPRMQLKEQKMSNSIKE